MYYAYTQPHETDVVLYQSVHRPIEWNGIIYARLVICGSRDGTTSQKDGYKPMLLDLHQQSEWSEDERSSNL